MKREKESKHAVAKPAIVTLVELNADQRNILIVHQENITLYLSVDLYSILMNLKICKTEVFLNKKAVSAIPVGLKRERPIELLTYIVNEKTLSERKHC